MPRVGSPIDIIYRKLQPRLFQKACRLTRGNTAVAEDLTQQAFIKFMDAQSRFAAESPAAPFLYVILKDQFYKLMNKASTRREKPQDPALLSGDQHPFDSDGPIQPGFSPSNVPTGLPDGSKVLAAPDLSVYTEDLPLFKRALHSRDQQLLHLFMSGYRQQEVADFFGVSRQRIGKLTKKLHRNLAELQEIAAHSQEARTPKILKIRQKKQASAARELRRFLKNIRECDASRPVTVSDLEAELNFPRTTLIRWQRELPKVDQLVTEILGTPEERQARYYERLQQQAAVRRREHLPKLEAAAKEYKRSHPQGTFISPIVIAAATGIPLDTTRAIIRENKAHLEALGLEFDSGRIGLPIEQKTSIFSRGYADLAEGRDLGRNPIKMEEITTKIRYGKISKWIVKNPEMIGPDMILYLRRSYPEDLIIEHRRRRIIWALDFARANHLTYSGVIDFSKHRLNVSASAINRWQTGDPEIEKILSRYPDVIPQIEQVQILRAHMINHHRPGNAQEIFAQTYEMLSEDRDVGRNPITIVEIAAAIHYHETSVYQWMKTFPEMIGPQMVLNIYPAFSQKMALEHRRRRIKWAFEKAKTDNEKYSMQGEFARQRLNMTPTNLSAWKKQDPEIQLILDYYMKNN